MVQRVKHATCSVCGIHAPMAVNPYAPEVVCDGCVEWVNRITGGPGWGCKWLRFWHGLAA